jgi:hypothetical protein
MSSDGSGFRVTVSTLRDESHLWGAQGDHMKVIATGAGLLSLGRLNSGIFQMITAANNSITGEVVRRATEAYTEMTKIQEALLQTAASYAEQERSTDAAMRKVRLPE